MEVEVEKWLERGLSVVLVGPRQSGKTTLLKYLANKHGWTYLTLEDPDVLRLFSDVKSVASLYKGNTLLIDEAQYDPEIGRKLKYLHDVEGMRFVASGSGSFDVKVKVSGELVGRAARLVLLPLSFGEFLRWKAPENIFEAYVESRKAVYNLLNGRDDEPPFRELPPVESLWKEYVVYGGYPAVVRAEATLKKELLVQIISAYVDRDVTSSLGVREKMKFLRVVEFLALSLGSPLKKSSVMDAARVSFPTLEFYLAILFSTFITFEVRPLPLSSVYLRKSPKIYFYDSGIRNVFTDNLKPFVSRDDQGVL
ncbi:MAG: ATP-binding protein, partial [Candidatus Diapherotrites archaeon]|nr:ATP-binding protein [Candidatus Diapherotrites archaeon]